MLVKSIVQEDFVNYKLPSMFIGTCICDWKCCKEGGFGIEICQNSSLSQQPNIDITIKKIYQTYIKNPITKAIVIGGLEPFKQFNEICDMIKYFRNNKCLDDIVIYTGYYKKEILKEITILQSFPNIIIKYGRYTPNNKPHYDNILGVNLISDNQYAEMIS